MKYHFHEVAFTEHEFQISRNCYLLELVVPFNMELTKEQQIFIAGIFGGGNTAELDLMFDGSFQKI